VELAYIVHGLLIDYHLLEGEWQFGEVGLVGLPLQVVEVVIDELDEYLIDFDADVLVVGALKAFHPAVLLDEVDELVAVVAELDDASLQPQQFLRGELFGESG
jgi:hypothetical protein